MKAVDIEIAITRLFNSRQNIIVPNVSWGAGLHECDMLIIRPKSGIAIEIEIKISKADLKKDLEKEHQHRSEKIAYLYYAVPKKLVEYAKEILPVDVGIISCKMLDNDGQYWIKDKIIRQAHIERKSEKRGKEKFTVEQMLHIAHLGTMRIWNLKKKIVELKEKEIVA